MTPNQLMKAVVAWIITFPWAMTASGVDFTPMKGSTVEDGAIISRVFFREGNKKIFFRPPNGWRMAGGGNDINFHPTSSAVDGVIRLGNSPVDLAAPLDANGRLAYAEAARKALPRQAESVEMISEQFDAYPLDDWKSYEIRFRYMIHETESMCSVLFISMTPYRQIWFVVDARKRDFVAVLAASRDLLGSWFEPPPGWPPRHGIRAFIGCEGLAARRYGLVDCWRG